MKELINIQSELKAPKSLYNKFGKYNYRSCETILDALKPLLTKHNCTLILSDEVKEIAGLPFVEATAIFRDSEGNEMTVRSQAGIDINKKGMDSAQCFGSSSSYARKYALNGLFLIDDTKDSDTQDNSHKKGKLEKSNPDLKKIMDLLSKGQTIEANNIASKYTITTEQLNYFKALVP